jgi:hypothetical protein
MFAIAGLLVALAAPAGSPATLAKPAGPKPAVIRVVARDFTFDAPDRIPAGAVTFDLTNEGKEPHHAWIVRFEGGHTLQEYEAALKQGPPPAWAVDIGGPQAMAPGGVSSATIDLKPGNYAFVCFVPGPDGVPHIMKGMGKAFTVDAASDGATLPKADDTIDLVDYAFVFMKPLHAGKQRVLFTNTSKQPHELVLWRLHDGKTVDDAIAWVKSMKGPPPGDLEGGMTGIAPGQEAIASLDLPPGHYAATCFLPDATDGKMHTEHGMKVEFDVK